MPRSMIEMKRVTLLLAGDHNMSRGCKLTTDEYKKQISNKSLSVLEEYIGTQKPIKHQCDVCHHIWKVQPHLVKCGRGCPVCARKNRTITTKEYKKQIPNKNIIVLEEYKGALTKIKHQCKVCSHIWKATPHNIKHNKGCIECWFKKSALDIYKNQKTTLYYIKIPSKNIWKIGITKNTPEERFRKEEFEFEIVATKTFEDGYEAYLLEQQIIKNNKNVRWHPKENEKFPGWTECFNVDLEEGDTPGSWRS